MVFQVVCGESAQSGRSVKQPTPKRLRRRSLLRGAVRIHGLQAREAVKRYPKPFR